MKKVLAVALLVTTAIASAQVHVRGYTKKDGTYVAPHERTAPDNTVLNNYSTKGNVNPYTGKLGTKNADDVGYQQIQPVQPIQPIQPTQPAAPQPPNPYQFATPQLQPTLVR